MGVMKKTQTVLGLEAVGSQRPGKDPAEENQPDPPAAVHHLQDQAQADQQQQVGQDVFLVFMDQTVGDVAPALIPESPQHQALILNTHSII